MKNLAVTLALVAPLGFAGRAAADNDDLATLRSSIGWGVSINPDRVGINMEGGWDGGAGKVTADATVEARLFARLSVFAVANFGGVYQNPRPALGAAYQIIDPRTGPYGLRVSAAYKPEGFTEPEGELEAVVVGTRRFGRHTARLMLAYGQDPEGAESDAEIGGSYLHRLNDDFVAGAAFRYRHSIWVNPTKMEPRWDLVAGGVVGLVLPHRSRVELLVGADSIAYTGPASTGVIGLVSVGTEL
jgi:hypothetical protein